MGRSHGQSPIEQFGRRAPLVAALIFLVAINLRSPLTTVGPVLPQISADHHLNEPMAGLLGALPLLMFAVVSPLVHVVSTRLGADRLLLAALVLLAAGVTLRSFAATPGLWIGTVVLGAAIAVGNVLVPVLIRRDYRRRISGATALYSACMGTVAATAAAVAVPIANRAGWQASLALWALPPLAVALLWLPRARAATPSLERLPAPVHPPVSVWRQPVAWVVTAFMGLQSTTFYILITWLPTISTASGFSAAQGGLHVFGLQLVGMAAGLMIPRLMRRPDSQVAAAVTASLPIVVGALGLLVAPGLTAGVGDGDRRRHRIIPGGGAEPDQHARAHPSRNHTTVRHGPIAGVFAGRGWTSSGRNPGRTNGHLAGTARAHRRDWRGPDPGGNRCRQGPSRHCGALRRAIADHPTATYRGGIPEGKEPS